MKLRNTTDIPDDFIRTILRHVKPSGLTKFDVMVKNSTYPYYGRAYSDGSDYHHSSDPFIVVRIGAEHFFPLKVPARKGYLPMVYETRMACFTAVLAHELRHLWQSTHKKGWRVWGSKGQFSERDADAYATKMMRLVRNELPEIYWWKNVPNHLA